MAATVQSTHDTASKGQPRLPISIDVHLLLSKGTTAAKAAELVDTTSGQLDKQPLLQGAATAADIAVEKQEQVVAQQEGMVVTAEAGCLPSAAVQLQEQCCMPDSSVAAPSGTLIQHGCKTTVCVTPAGAKADHAQQLNPEDIQITTHVTKPTAQNSPALELTAHQTSADASLVPRSQLSDQPVNYSLQTCPVNVNCPSRRCQIEGQPLATVEVSHGGCHVGADAGFLHDQSRGITLNKASAEEQWPAPSVDARIARLSKGAPAQQLAQITTAAMPHLLTSAIYGQTPFNLIPQAALGPLQLLPQLQQASSATAAWLNVVPPLPQSVVSLLSAVAQQQLEHSSHGGAEMKSSMFTLHPATAVLQTAGGPAAAACVGSCGSTISMQPGHPATVWPLFYSSGWLQAAQSSKLQGKQRSKQQQGYQQSRSTRLPGGKRGLGVLKIRQVPECKRAANKTNPVAAAPRPRSQQPAPQKLQAGTGTGSSALAHGWQCRKSTSQAVHGSLVSPGAVEAVAALNMLAADSSSSSRREGMQAGSLNGRQSGLMLPPAPTRAQKLSSADADKVLPMAGTEPASMAAATGRPAVVPCIHPAAIVNPLLLQPLYSSSSNICMASLQEAQLQLKVTEIITSFGLVTAEAPRVHSIMQAAGVCITVEDVQARLSDVHQSWLQAGGLPHNAPMPTGTALQALQNIVLQQQRAKVIKAAAQAAATASLSSVTAAQARSGSCSPSVEAVPPKQYSWASTGTQTNEHSSLLGFSGTAAEATAAVVGQCPSYQLQHGQSQQLKTQQGRGSHQRHECSTQFINAAGPVATTADGPQQLMGPTAPAPTPGFLGGPSAVAGQTKGQAAAVALERVNTLLLKLALLPGLPMHVSRFLKAVESKKHYLVHSINGAAAADHVLKLQVVSSVLAKLLALPDHDCRTDLAQALTQQIPAGYAASTEDHTLLDLLMTCWLQEMRITGEDWLDNAAQVGEYDRAATAPASNSYAASDTSETALSAPQSRSSQNVSGLAPHIAGTSRATLHILAEACRVHTESATVHDAVGVTDDPTKLTALRTAYPLAEASGIVSCQLFALELLSGLAVLLLHWPQDGETDTAADGELCLQASQWRQRLVAHSSSCDMGEADCQIVSVSDSNSVIKHQLGQLQQGIRQQLLGLLMLLMHKKQLDWC
jgi:hypothetical protein